MWQLEEAGLQAQKQYCDTIGMLQDPNSTWYSLVWSKATIVVRIAALLR